MFTFVPPAKVARTQRSRGFASRGSVGPIESENVGSSMRSWSGGRESALRSRKAASLTVASELGTTDGEDLSISAPLSGIGTNLCWAADEAKAMIRIWSIQVPWVRSTPWFAQIPTVRDGEGPVAFVTEIMHGESLAFCTTRGVVVSLDNAFDFQFFFDNCAVAATSFAVGVFPLDSAGQLCSGNTDAPTQMCRIAAVGTQDGMVLVSKKVAGSHSMGVYHPTVSMVRGADSPNQQPGTWSLWSWLAGNPNPHSSDRAGGESGSHRGADGTPASITYIKLSEKNVTWVWALNDACELLLLDHGLEGGGTTLRLRWVARIAELLGAQGPCAGRIAAFAEGTKHCYVLFVASPARSTTGQFQAPLCAIVTLLASTGAIVNVAQLNGIKALATAEFGAPSKEVRLYVDEATSTATILFGAHVALVSCTVGVRTPCTSEDVFPLTEVGDPVASAILSDGSIITLDANGPVVTYRVDRAASDHGRPRRTTTGAVCVLVSHDHDISAGVKQQVAGILSAVRIDQRLSIDEAVLQASEEVCMSYTTHAGNWARTDLDEEDGNLMFYVTRSLHARQQRHRQLLLEVLQNEEIAPFLQSSTIAKIISDQEMLLACVGLRRLQNEGLPNLATADSDGDGVLSLVSRGRGVVIGGTRSDARTEKMEYLRAARSALERERCQTMLRNGIVQLARQIRESGCGEQRSTPGSRVERLTAAEQVFANPANIAALLHTLHTTEREVFQCLSTDLVTKFQAALALSTILVTTIQCVEDSRRDLTEHYGIDKAILRQLWTSSSEPRFGVEVILAECCVALCSVLASTVLVVHEKSESRPARIAADDQAQLLDLIEFLLYFVFENHSLRGPAFLGSALRATLLRAPFVEEPFGYPHGAPRANADPGTAQLCGHIVQLCEDLALHFDIPDAIVSYTAADKIEEPLDHVDRYSTLGRFCERNPLVFGFVLEALLAQGRELELQYLPQLVPSYAAGAVEHDAFIAQRAPHIQWIVNPEAFHALVREGVMEPSRIAYGDTRVSHRSRCASMSKLAWIACGAPITNSYFSLNLDLAVVKAQKAFLLPQMEDVHLEVGDLVQRLLELGTSALSNANADSDPWIAAAEVLSVAPSNLRMDLLIQVLRRAKENDGDALSSIRREGVSDLEISMGIMRTASGRVLRHCAQLQQNMELLRACKAVFDTREADMLVSWIAAIMSGSG